MFNTMVPINNKMSWRDKARLNICIAKDLADSFGGRKADYLIRLNRKLRIKIAIGSANFTNCLAKAAYHSFQAGEIDDLQPSL
jgi:hypothetical protein